MLVQLLVSSQCCQKHRGVGQVLSDACDVTGPLVVLLFSLGIIQALAWASQCTPPFHTLESLVGVILGGAGRRSSVINISTQQKE